MSSFADILEGQIEAERKAQPRTPRSDSDSRKVIQKKAMIPLMADAETSEPTRHSIATEGGTDTPAENGGGSLWGDHPDESQQERLRGQPGGALWGDHPDSAVTAEPKKNEQQNQPHKGGGALWGDHLAPPPQATPGQEGRCLMDLIMAPPPKEMPKKPTLFTYFDQLVANGEV